MNKLKLIIQREFIAKVRNKSFIIMTFLSPLAMVGMTALIIFLMNKNNEKIKTIAYVDDAKIFEKSDFKDTKNVKFVDYTTLGIDQTKKKVKQDDYYGVVYIPKKEHLETLAKSVEFYSEDSPNVDIISGIENNIDKKLQNLKLKSYDIDLEKIKASKLNTDIKLFDFSGEKTSKLNGFLKLIFGIGAGYLLMMFVIIYGQSVMRSVIEEKTSRIIEVIVSSVKPFQLMMGKIIGNAMAGLLQFIIWGILGLVLGVVVLSLLGLNISDVQTSGMTPTSEQLKAIEETAKNSEFMNIAIELFKLPLVSMFILFIFYFLGGYLLYSSLYAAIGAAVDNETDSQQFTTPVILTLSLAVYVGFSSVIKDPHGPIAVIFSHIPLTSPIVMLMRYPFGVVWWEVAISMTTLILTFLGLVWLAAKIYRVGILSYGKKATYKDLIKWIKFKE